MPLVLAPAPERNLCFFRFPSFSCASLPVILASIVPPPLPLCPVPPPTAHLHPRLTCYWPWLIAVMDAVHCPSSIPSLFVHHLVVFLFCCSPTLCPNLHRRSPSSPHRHRRFLPRLKADASRPLLPPPLLLCPLPALPRGLSRAPHHTATRSRPHHLPHATAEATASDASTAQGKR